MENYSRRPTPVQAKQVFAETVSEILNFSKDKVTKSLRAKTLTLIIDVEGDFELAQEGDWVVYEDEILKVYKDEDFNKKFEQ